MKTNAFAYSFWVYLSTSFIWPIIYVMIISLNDASHSNEFLGYSFAMIFVSLILGLPCWGVMWFLGTFLLSKYWPIGRVRLSLSLLGSGYIITLICFFLYNDTPYHLSHLSLFIIPIIVVNFFIWILKLEIEN